MTKIDAKALTLKVWRYLKWHPWLTSKNQLPENIHKQIEGLACECPLCEVHFDCIGCPLVSCLAGYSFTNWVWSVTWIGRFLAASEIVKKIKRWKV
jgi:hypothetical protein